MTNNKVRQYAERIERLLDERVAIDADIKDIYTEVKAADLKPKVLRKAIANKRRKVDAQFEAQVEEYASLLLAMPGATYRSVAEQTGIPKSTLHRRVPREENGTADPETGEITNGRQVGTEAGRGTCAHPGDAGRQDAALDGPVARRPEGDREGADRAAEAEGKEVIQTGERDVASQVGASQPVPTASLPLSSPEREARPDASESCGGTLTESRSPEHESSAGQPCDTGNAAVVPTREDGSAGERDPIQTMSHDEIWDRVGESPAMAARRAVTA